MCYDVAYELRLPNARTLELQHIEKELEPPSDQIILVTDSKSIYDVLRKRNVEGVDKRAGMELRVVLDSMRIHQGTCRWVPHSLNPADAMTKLRANWTPLLQALGEAKVRIVEESTELKERKDYREMTGKANPRPSIQSRSTKTRCSMTTLMST
eukprot:6488907-Amphidinium_carterae.1